MPTITVPHPCHENWAAMTPAAQGRHCESCDKVVVDFTHMTEEEIVTTLRQSIGLCGRFRPEQVSTPATQKPSFAGSWAQWLAAAAVALSSCEMPNAQQLHLRPAPIVVDGQQVIITGRVVDKADGRPLPAALVMSLADNAYRTNADSAGHFQLKLPLHLRDSLLYAVATASPEGYTMRYIGRRFLPAQAASIRLRTDPNDGLLGTPTPPVLESDELYGTLKHELVAPPPPPQFSKIDFTPPENIIADSAEVPAVTE